MHRTRTVPPPSLAVAAGALVLLGLVGCGNKGDLYLPVPEADGPDAAAPVLPELEGARDAPPGRPAEAAPPALPAPGPEGEGEGERGRRRSSP